MKKIFPFAVLALFFGLINNTVTAGGDDFIAVHPVYCQSERDIADLANVNNSGHSVRRLIRQKVDAGRCNTPAMLNKKAGIVVERLTPEKRAPYYCFTEEVEPGVFTKNYTCVLDRFIMPIKDYVASRNGNYRIKNQGANYYRAQCAEGGEITIEKRGSEYYRISDALQLTTDVKVPALTAAGSDLEKALRDGCRGVDFL
jgi:hypothetical protein